MKRFALFAFVITVAEILFSAIYYLISGKPDKILLPGLIIYAGVMITGFIAYSIIHYRHKKKTLMDSLISEEQQNDL
jgi:hypothetical protein